MHPHFPFRSCSATLSNGTGRLGRRLNFTPPTRPRPGWGCDFFDHTSRRSDKAARQQLLQSGRSKAHRGCDCLREACCHHSGPPPPQKPLDDQLRVHQANQQRKRFTLWFPGFCKREEEENNGSNLVLFALKGIPDKPILPIVLSFLLASANCPYLLVLFASGSSISLGSRLSFLLQNPRAPEEGFLKGSVKGSLKAFEGSSYLSAEGPFKTPSKRRH